MENNLIIQDDLKTHIRSLTGMFTDDGFYVPIDAVLGAIDFAQTIDAEPVRHGEWIVESRSESPFDGVSIKCSVCYSYVLKKTNYCPNCGAKMDGDTEDATN